MSRDRWNTEFNNKEFYRLMAVSEYSDQARREQVNSFNSLPAHPTLAVCAVPSSIIIKRLKSKTYTSHYIKSYKLPEVGFSQLQFRGGSL